MDEYITDNAYYLPADPAQAQAGDGWEYFTPSESVVSVWSTDIQHGGPPTGLLARSLRHAAGGDDGPVAFSRITTDILGAIGLGTNRVRGEVLRPGRQISLIGAELQVADGNGAFRTAATARAWVARGSASAAIDHSPREPMTPLPGELEIRAGVTPDSSLGVDWGTVGFIGTTETAWVPGRNGRLSAVWIRPIPALVAGETTDLLDSLCVVADVANGVGSELDPRQWTWMNLDTTLHLLRRPVGTWIALDAELCAGPDGYGATFADLYDEDGFVGRTAQTVLLSAH
ncbi:thioesterase family protein [Gordonia crocea]|uniref:Thioesterase n=1 Tax=Gordonia crocea TaxID=589162 RepID=A0A7I9UY61_9ACTN|nr:thioesterase family protein [Gordonia crocea]GED98118.1 hypothetical protein nbrc107697_21570 [Gordonia crocea]